MTDLPHVHNETGECLACDFADVRAGIGGDRMPSPKEGADAVVALDRISTALATSQAQYVSLLEVLAASHARVADLELANKSHDHWVQVADTRLAQLRGKDRRIAELDERLAEEQRRGESAEYSLSEALGMTTFCSDGSVENTGEWQAMIAKVAESEADREHLEEARFVAWLMLNPRSEHPLQPSNWRAANWLKAELKFQAQTEAAAQERARKAKQISPAPSQVPDRTRTPEASPGDSLSVAQLDARRDGVGEDFPTGK